MQVYSETGNSTSRLFILKSLFSREKNNIILTDSETEIENFLEISSEILGKKIIKISQFSDFFTIANQKNSIFIAHTDIFRNEGNLYQIQKKENIHVARGSTETIENIIEKLIDFWYEYDASLSEIFTYKKEGGILSIMGNTTEYWYQIEWFDTEIDAIIVNHTISRERKFNNELTIGNHKNAEKNFEKKDEKRIEFQPKINSELVNSLPDIVDNSEIFLVWCDFLQEKNILQNIATVHISEINDTKNEKINTESPHIEDISELITYISNKKNSDFPIEIFTRNKKNVEEFFDNNNISNVILHEVRSRKFESFFIAEFGNNNDFPKCVIADDIIGKIFVRKRRRGSLAKNLDLLITLSPWDYVVHRDHGIAKFEAIVKKKVGELEREYLELHYAENDKLFVPITEIFRISKYLGSDDVILTRLGTKEWERTLSKTDEELQQIAENILETNAKRELSAGRAFGKFPKEEQEFRDNFPHDYTNDQLNGILEVFADMEKEQPMDRLLSGDVGFWKTEIAMNASYKAFLSGYQVAVISPLVVLALEHYESFVERLGKFGVKIALLSRMNTPKEAAEILEWMRTGEINIVIGTHRLLSEDVKWKKLGLLIIDEEHKFGVTHKEKIKQIRAGIDILSLSATPIPRSLNMALSGLRQISLLTTPPKLKKPIETIITNWNQNIIRTALEHELSRNGQIIIVHNRIKWIESVQQELEEILSGSNYKPKIIITHGRMNGDEIEDRIRDFKEHKYNILLTTTIIENGVNFLRANTIIIIDPEDFGLASLHQLRGRVGRKWDQWFCYLAYRKLEITNEEKERLLTIANNNHLGAGFEIAMRDMELRGAGDILGIKQSGKSKDVGLPLYFRMLDEKIAELKSEKQKKIFTKIELDISYILPDEYFISELDKLHFFREAENIDTLEELENLEKELQSEKNDENISNLFLLLQARIVFWDFWLIKISRNGNFYVLDFQKGNTIAELKNFLDIFDQEKNMIVVTPEKVRVDAKNYASSRDFLRSILNQK